jgi:transposase-like protein
VVALVDLSGLLDEAKCLELVRRTRWPQGVRCSKCGGGHVARNGHDETQRQRQRHVCTDCGARFDDLSDTVLAGDRQPLKVSILCLYFRGLSLSNRQIAHELGRLALFGTRGDGARITSTRACSSYCCDPRCKERTARGRDRKNRLAFRTSNPQPRYAPVRRLRSRLNAPG